MSATKESVWTKKDLQKLLAAMKTNIPKLDIKRAYPKGMKNLDWTKVAFAPFSPEECQEKWKEILQKMRKTRTLTELIDEAEGAISNPHSAIEINPYCPKRPAPPNTIFYEENWAKYQKKHPKMTPLQLLNYVFKKYKGLSEEKKAPYVEKYKAAMEKYKKSKAEFCKEYNATSDDDHDGTPSKKRKKHSEDTLDISTQSTEDGLPSKPPFNGYNLFCREQSASMMSVSGNTSVSMWAQCWRDLSENEKDKYSTRCKELKRKYAVKLNEYLKGFDHKTQQQILETNGIKRPKEGKMWRSGRKPPQKLPGEPKMPAQSGNAIFCKQQMQLQKEEFPNSRERFIHVSQLWKELSKKKKERYNEQVKENVRKYSVELRKWYKKLPAEEQEAYRTRNPSKLKYLDAIQIEVIEPQSAVYVPSDSEDEDMESSSSEEDNSDCQKVEEEDDDVIAFPAY